MSPRQGFMNDFAILSYPDATPDGAEAVDRSETLLLNLEPQKTLNVGNRCRPDRAS
jgi:hypothetical protein